MFLSVVILGGFTTEAHAMAHLITTDRPDDYSHHQTDATRRAPFLRCRLLLGKLTSIDPAIQVRVTYLRAVPRWSPGQQKTHRKAQRRKATATSPTRFTALPRHHNAPERVGLPGG